MYLYVDTDVFPVLSNSFTGLTLGGCPADGWSESYLEAVRVTGFDQQIPGSSGVVFVYPARVGLAFMAHPVSHVQNVSESRQQFVNDGLAVDGYGHRLLHLHGIGPFR